MRQMCSLCGFKGLACLSSAPTSALPLTQRGACQSSQEERSRCHGNTVLTVKSAFGRNVWHVFRKIDRLVLMNSSIRFIKNETCCLENKHYQNVSSGAGAGRVKQLREADPCAVLSVLEVNRHAEADPLCCVILEVSAHAEADFLSCVLCTGGESPCGG